MNDAPGRTRAHRRHLAALSVEVDYRGCPLALDARDVGAAGLFVVSDLLLEVGALVFVHARLPDGGTLTGPARVARVEDSGSAPGMALAFCAPSPLDGARIERAFAAGARTRATTARRAG